MAERIPPHSKEAEQSALGAALISKDALIDVTDRLKPDDFYNGAHKEIYAAMLDLFKEDKNVDIVTVSDELKKRGSLEAAGGRSYIADLPTFAPTAVNASGYADIVAEKADLRALISAADEIKASGFDEELTSGSILDRAEQKIFQIAQNREQSEYVPLREVLEENIELIDKASKNKGDLLGVPTGFDKLDDILKGLQRSDLIVLAARPGMGKSAFALNVALNAAKKNDASVLIFNLEMPKTQLGLRLLSMESNVEMEKLQTGQNLTSEEWRYISVATDNLSRLKIGIDETPGITVMKMKNKCRRYKKEHGLDLIIVDYLQLMESEGRVENRQQEISKISRAFKILAREMDCPVLLLSQLSREPEKRTDHRPINADLRESGAIEQDADVIIFLYRGDQYAKDGDEDVEQGVCEVNVSKHRNGPTGMVKLTFVERYTRFNNRAEESK